ncbi:hypothetical protein Ocin01_06160 [Orchesella cincta]|uniref:Uncharacterized protein n=1 Tax=Orchesella cincta TaxID=48709 RepID=A0A1D2N6C9_ORCCI|nr:hypothetical protein Ocin01_06160 [Orchesella cincta]
MFPMRHKTPRHPRRSQHEVKQMSPAMKGIQRVLVLRRRITPLTGVNVSASIHLLLRQKLIWRVSPKTEWLAPSLLWMCGSSSKDKPAYERREEDDDGDNDETTMKQFGVVGNQRIQAASTTCFIRSHLSTGIHKASAQRLPKGIRGHSRPWYEIEGSDDEGSLLRVAETRSTHASRFASSNSSSSSNPAPESSENESERNGNSEEEDKSEAQQQNQQPTTHNYQKFL